MIEGEADIKWLKSKINDKAKYELVVANWHDIFVKKLVPVDKRFIKVKVGKYSLFLRRGSLAPSLMTYVEIFRDKTHVDFKGFNGKSSRVVFDIGANEGYYTLFLKQTNPHIKVIAVEPIKPTYEVLSRNVAGNHLSKVELVNKAVTAKSGFVTFETVPEATAIAAMDIGLQARPWLDPKRIKKVKVKSISLLDLAVKHGVDHIDILKLDVEGVELEILKGSEGLLKNIDKVVLEYHSKELRNSCIDLLSSNGFKLVKEDVKDYGDIYFIK